MMAAGAVSWLLDWSSSALWTGYPLYFYNASVLSNSTEIELLVPEDEREGSLVVYLPHTLTLTSPAQLGLATGLLLALVIHARRDLTKERQWAQAAVSRVVAAAWCVALAAAALPAAVLLLALCGVYRALVGAALSLALGDDFAGLLAGADAVWAVETDSALAVINVLALVQVDEEGCDARRLLCQLRSLLQRKLESGELPEKLLLLRRHSPLGYFYWQRRPRPLPAAALVREHVRWLDERDDPAPGVGGAPQEWLLWSVLKKRVSELANSPLPHQHAACWEMLVGEAPMAPELDRHDLFTAMEEGFPDWSTAAASGAPKLFPVLFRVHHSVGDGVALLNLLMDTIAGKQVVRWLQNGKDFAGTPERSNATSPEPQCKPKWTPVRPATPASDLRRESPLPSSRSTTPFQCYIDATGSVSFNNQKPAAINSKVVTQVGAAQNGALSPLSRPGSPVSRPTSPVPPYISTSPLSYTPRKRILNGQNPLRPCSPNGIRLHYYNGADSFVTFPDDICAGSSNLGERNSTTIYYYNPADGGTLTSSKKATSEIQGETLEERNSRSSSLESIDSSTLFKRNTEKPKHLVRSVSFDVYYRPKDARKMDKNGNFKIDVHRISTSGRESVNEMRDEEVKIPHVKIEEISVDCQESKEGASDSEIPEDWLKPEQHVGGSKAPKVNRTDCEIKSLADNLSENNTEMNMYGNNSFIKEHQKQRNIQAHESSGGGARHEWLLSSVSRRYDAALVVTRALCALLFAPAALLHQALLHEAASRDGPLHVQQLSGRKSVSWLSEPHLLDVVRDVRRRLPEVRFCDVLLAALSGALERHLGERAPRAVTVVVPERLQEPAGGRGHLDNRFSVALLPLPVTSSPHSPLARLAEVARLTGMLRHAPDYQVNYWMMRVAAAALPSAALRALSHSARSSAVLSNMRGPDRMVSLAGHPVRDLVFWVPNRGVNGLGVSVLSYAGTLQLGLMIDQSVGACPDDDSLLLAAIATELHRLDSATAV